MVRRLSAEERALWRKVVETVRPLQPGEISAAEPLPAEPGPVERAPPAARPPAAAFPARLLRRKPVQAPGTTLDGSWDRRLSRGMVSPDTIVDLHGHHLASAHDLLDRRLEQSIHDGDRLLLLITGKPPSEDRRPVARGAIRAAVGDWLSASRHAGRIAAVRNAHPRHGGAGALYIILRRPQGD